jgi:hypothetical protein
MGTLDPQQGQGQNQGPGLGWTGSRFSSGVSDGLAGRAYVPVWCSGANGANGASSASGASGASGAADGSWSQHKQPSMNWTPFSNPSCKAPSVPATLGSAFYSPFAVCDEI